MRKLRFAFAIVRTALRSELSGDDGDNQFRLEFVDTSGQLVTQPWGESAAYREGSPATRHNLRGTSAAGGGTVLFRAAFLGRAVSDGIVLH